MTAGSSATSAPKMWTRVGPSGGGIGYTPRLISIKERPRDQTSEATEYWEPCKRTLKHRNFNDHTNTSFPSGFDSPKNISIIWPLFNGPISQLKCIGLV